MINKRYTDEEILKALECCLCDNSECLQCQNKELCEMERDELAVRTLDLISSKVLEIDRLKAEIKRLHKENKILSRNADTAFQDGLNECRELFAPEIKAEAYKTFAEKLKEEFLNLQYNANTDRKNVKIEELKQQMDWLLHTVAIETVENLLKEMVGEKIL